MVFRRWEISERAAPELTLERLKSLLHYDPRTGRFTHTGNRRKTMRGAYAAKNGHPERYVTIGVDRKSYYAHRLAWFYVYGKWPDGNIDHKNRRKNDNRIENLRVCNQSQNAANSRVQMTSKTGVKGVTYREGKFHVQVKVSGKTNKIGVFATLKEAAEAYAEGAKKAFGEFSYPDREPEIRRYNNRRPKNSKCYKNITPVVIMPMSKLLGVTNKKDD